MTDARLKSLTENGANLVVGFPINYVANILILPRYDFTHDTYWLALEIGIWFSIISVVRAYGFRRLFERFGENENAYTLLAKLVRKIARKA